MLHVWEIWTCTSNCSLKTQPKTTNEGAQTINEKASTSSDNGSKNVDGALEATKESIYGEWITVSKPRRRPVKPSADVNGEAVPAPSKNGDQRSSLGAKSTEKSKENYQKKVPKIRGRDLKFYQIMRRR